MESLRELYRIGYGPSSSHTMGPRYAALDFLSAYSQAPGFKADLFGSLAATGKGHLTDQVLKDVFEKAGKTIEISWHPEEFKDFHPNALTLKAFGYADDELIGEETYYSVGGGKILREKDRKTGRTAPYPGFLGSMADILRYCENEGLRIWEIPVIFEGPSIMDFITDIWEAMCASIESGLSHEGVLPGGLKLARKAAQVNARAQGSGPTEAAVFAMSYALAVSEENAGGGQIVTAPTCGASGVLPGVLYYFYKHRSIPRAKILRALLTAGVIGNLVKENGSISGAEVGCQGEVGVACSMAGGAAVQLLGGTIYQIEYAAEMGLEHHLGLTCDPMLGLVQIPCIERNALATMRAIDHAAYALISDGRHKVSFDDIIGVMMETGHALPSLYRETSMGGLAKVRSSK
ncbi:L-serine ammonia-lyase [Parasphaerochaeta coccoides]|uniref:L-serine dehydratase n=1 Tax=Parasphaerochaeta coccoides (strain ATCC BAA-1237 / DSM 17374 / SPN1) TaxID=760011 RepID=F4GJ23_PARC1|nr:L-serine ammonia-lyase [Parasphaerochaeta coccoides]AEC01318.1 L-serine ammonia-lyase [Parasphaerochaeta coccoides DSM 17374]